VGAPQQNGGAGHGKLWCGRRWWVVLAPSDGVEARVAEEVGDQDEVSPATDEGGGEGVPADVCGDVLVQAGGLGDGVEDLAGAAMSRFRRISAELEIALSEPRQAPKNQCYNIGCG
jgi:hypothetical protein